MAKNKKNDAKAEKAEDKVEETEEKVEATAEQPDAAEEKTEKAEEKAEKAEEKAEPSKEEQLEKDLAASKEALMRTLAEYDNYRKRSVKEKEAAYNDSKANVLKDILPILDDFDRALSADNDFDALKKGMEMISTKFTNALEKLGVETFGEVGETFDPNIHNAVMKTEDEKLGENTIAQVFAKGYKLGDRIIRTATVIVANCD